MKVKRLSAVLIAVFALAVMPLVNPEMKVSAATTLQWPVPGHTNIGSGFRPADRPDHDGIDIIDTTIAGAPIVAAIGGTVTVKHTCTRSHYPDLHTCEGFGTGLVIYGDDGYYYNYGHMQAGSIPSNISVGSRVNTGQKIGNVGTTGCSTSEHLHFGISTKWYDASSFINPMSRTYNYGTAPSTTTYVFRYNANGGTGTMADTQMISGQTGYLAKNKFQKYGYKFAGWRVHLKSINKWHYRSADKTQHGWYAQGKQPSGWDYYIYSDGSLVGSHSSVNGDVVTLYAQWIPITYSFKYNGNGGTGTMADTKLEYGKTGYLAKNKFQKYGYKFVGWRVHLKSINKWHYISADRAQHGWYAQGQQPSGWDYYIYTDGSLVGSHSSVNGDVVTLYAQWTPITYSFKYNGNGGTGTMADTKLEYGKTTNLTKNQFKKLGHKFTGWRVHLKSINKWHYISADRAQHGWYAQGQQPSGWDYYIYTDGSVVGTHTAVEDDVVGLYAVWYPCTHTWDEGKVTTATTSSYEGVRTHTCTVCSATKTERIPRLANAGSNPNQNSSDEHASGSEYFNTVQEIEEVIFKTDDDSDPAGSEFSKLLLRSPKQTKNSISLKWKKADGADRYIIYGNKCGAKNKLVKLCTVTGTTRKFTKVASRKVTKGTYYKFVVVAADGERVVSTSKVIHVATKGGKIGNHKGVKTAAKNNKVSLRKGKSFRLKARVVAANKKLKVKNHVGIRYETTNPRVATVSRKGVITAKGKGSCTVYVYAQNGIYKAVRVKVS